MNDVRRVRGIERIRQWDADVEQPIEGQRPTSQPLVKVLAHPIIPSP